MESVKVKIIVHLKAIKNKIIPSRYTDSLPNISTNHFISDLTGLAYFDFQIVAGKGVVKV